MLRRILKPLLIAAIAILPFATIAQSIFKEGYVVAANDTLSGYLKEDIESNLINGVLFSKNASGTPNQMYTASDIKAFYFTHGNTFQLVRYNDINGVAKQNFAKLLLKGYYDLYSFRQDERQYFVIAEKDTAYFLCDDKQLVNGEMDQKGNFKNLLRFLSNDCVSITGELDRLPYNERTIIDYIAKLNTCKAPAEKNSSYYVKADSKMAIYAYAGALPLGDNSQYTGRVIARFSLPSISKNTFINTGINYQRRRNMEEYTSFYNPAAPPFKKPRTFSAISAGLTLQNNFTTGVVQPYLEAGLGFAYKKEEIYRPNARDARQKYGIDVIAAIGVEGYVTKHLAVKADWRYELIVNYPTIGVAYFFK